jgi:hypothetical protein
VKQLGGLDVLVNNLADHVQQERLEDISAEQLRLTFENNVFPFLPDHAPCAGAHGQGWRDHQHRLGDLVPRQPAPDRLRLDQGAPSKPSPTRWPATSPNAASAVNGVAPGPIWDAADHIQQEQEGAEGIRPGHAD